ncbi:MAG: plastocyanin/azurin family copper-binding protein [Acidobacteriaceae bacterium]
MKDFGKKVKNNRWKLLAFSLIGGFAAVLVSALISNASYSTTSVPQVVSYQQIPPQAADQSLAPQSPVYVTSPSLYANVPATMVASDGTMPTAYVSSTAGSVPVSASVPASSAPVVNGCSWVTDSLYAWTGSTWVPVSCWRSYAAANPTISTSYMEVSPINNCGALWGPTLSPAQPAGWYKFSGSTIRPLLPSDCPGLAGLPGALSASANTISPTSSVPSAPSTVPVNYVVPNAAAQSPQVVSQPPAASSSISSVTIGDDFFTPQNISIPAGTTVTWANSGTMAHTVTADNGSFNSGTLNPGMSFSETFPTPGTFPYYCQFHGARGGIGMSGMVTVTSSGSGSAVTPKRAPNSGPDNAPYLVQVLIRITDRFKHVTTITKTFVTNDLSQFR